MFVHQFKKGFNRLKTGATHNSPIFLIPLDKSSIVQFWEMGVEVTGKRLFWILILTIEFVLVAWIVSSDL
ncbi:hypothetical protein BG842_00565 [Haladaptatus sp. W1]|nr:hypothetical protein BG842_00565 [Haladaptatus sp. W1]